MFSFSFRIISILFILIIFNSCTQEKEVTQAEVLVVSKLDGYLPNTLYYTFGIDLDSLKNNTNEIREIRGEISKIKHQKGNTTDFYNDFYIWGRFTSSKIYDVKKTRFKAISTEDKLFLKNYYLELLPDSEKELFPYELDLDSLDCYFMYQYPFRSSRIRGFNLLMFERKTKSYYYLKCTGRYVKEVENGIEIEPLKIPHYELFVKENIKNYYGRSKIFPLTGSISYVAIKNNKTEAVLDNRFFRDTFSEITKEQNKNNVREWISFIDDKLFSDIILKSPRIDRLFYNLDDQSKRGDGENKKYRLTILTYNEITKNHILAEIYYFDNQGENHSKYIYNPLESEFEAKDK